MIGLVIKKNAALFSVESQGKIYHLPPSGKTKEIGIYVGDKVEFEENITKVLPRKNILIRPPVANIDRMFIVISPKPKPDFELVDKIIVYCHLKDIEPIIVINKMDIASLDLTEKIKKDYRCYKVIECSAKNNEVENLKSEIKGICAFAGQSAVGKTSLINSLFKLTEEVGELSQRVERGKQTTRIVSLFKIGENYIADTAGFSLLDLNFISDLTPRELSSYYPEFLEGRARCKYRSCLHEGGECGVVEDVKSGKIEKGRYQNYLKILEELKNRS